MDAIVIAFVASLAVAFAIAAGVAINRGRALDAIDSTLRDAERGTPRPSGPAGEDLTDRVGRLRRRAEGAELALEQRLRDLGYLADLVGVGIVRLTDDLNVEVANTAAHVFLGRESG